VGAKRGHLEGFINMSIFLHSPKGSMKVVKMKGEVLFAESVHFFFFWRHIHQVQTSNSRYVRQVPLVSICRLKTQALFADSEIQWLNSLKNIITVKYQVDDFPNLVIYVY